MPKYIIPLPDGTEMGVEAPEGATRADAARFAEREYRKEAKKAGALSAVASGATFGLNDEITGFLSGIESLLSGGDYSTGYEKGRDLTREAMRIFGEDHPVIQLALEFGGGMLTGGALFKAMKVLTGGRAGAVTTGAVGGGLAGVGTGETAEERALGGAIGAGAGAALGKTIDAVGSVIPGMRAGAQADRAKEAILAGRSVDEAGSAIEDLNRGFDSPWARYADVNPEYAQTAMTSAPPAEAKAFADTLNARQRLQAPLMEQATKDITGVSDSRVAARTALQEQLTREGAEMYNPLRGQPVTPTQEMLDTMSTPNGQRAVEHTLKAMREQTGNADLSVEDVAGSWDFWHNYQQVLRDIGTGKLNSDVPLSGIEGRAVMARRQQIMNDLFGDPDWGEAYRSATNRFKNNKELIEALDSSDKFASLSRDQVKEALGRLKTDEERAAFAAGAINDMIERSLRNPDTADIARKMVRTPALRQNLEMVLGEEKLMELDDAMSRLSKMTQTKNVVVEGSQTQPRQERVARIAAGDDTALEHFANLQFGTGIKNMLGIGTGRTIPDDVALQMLRASAARNPIELSGAINALENIRLQRQAPNQALFGGLNAIGSDYY